MFNSFRARLMASYSALLLVCLGIVAIVGTALVLLWVSLPGLAYTQLTDAAVPVLTELRAFLQPERQFAEGFPELGEIARANGVRLLLVGGADGAILADSNREWVGKRVRLNVPAQEALSTAALRGRTRGPDGRIWYYLAAPVRDVRTETTRLAYLVLTLRGRDALRPVIGSVAASVLVSGAVAFALSAIMALWLARTLSRPLQDAAAAAEQVAGGDYDTRLDAAGPDEARRLAHSFNAMTAAVAASHRSQRDFVANVSHELKTPLTSIGGFAQALLDGTAGDPQSVRRAATVIHDESERLSRLVETLLDLTRLESGKVSMSRDPVDLAALCHSSADRFAPLAQQQAIELIVRAPDELVVVGDGDRLLQVLTNLVDNAIKHTERGGKVTLSTERDGEQVLLSVTDTGCGIPAEDLPRLFERFYQVDKSRSRERRTDRASVGLGLALSSEIVRAHGGRIDVESIVRVGTRFTVRLPGSSARLPGGEL
ncbi:MAG: HAMP domain-containing protein [Anaerolineae bacterium]|nr:HAMP domain-containing protein [Anaerolineae bacterium]